jgi:hypothetical protein
MDSFEDRIDGSLKTAYFKPNLALPKVIRSCDFRSGKGDKAWNKQLAFGHNEEGGRPCVNFAERVS